MSVVDEPEPLLRIAADVTQLAAVRAFIREHGRRAGADPLAVSDLVQAVDESVTNAIEHGYAGRPGEVEVEVAVDRLKRSMVVRLRDRAPAFDPTRLPAPDTTLPLDQRPLGGMGVFLTRELSDAVIYRRIDDSNELTIVKQCIDEQGGERC